MLESEHDAGQNPAAEENTAGAEPGESRSDDGAGSPASGSDAAATGVEGGRHRRAASRAAGPPASRGGKRADAAPAATASPQPATGDGENTAKKSTAKKATGAKKSARSPVQDRNGPQETDAPGHLADDDPAVEHGTTDPAVNQTAAAPSESGTDQPTKKTATRKSTAKKTTASTARSRKSAGHKAADQESTAARPDAANAGAASTTEEPDSPNSGQQHADKKDAAKEDAGKKDADKEDAGKEDSDKKGAGGPETTDPESNDKAAGTKATRGKKTAARKSDDDATSPAREQDPDQPASAEAATTRRHSDPAADSAATGPQHFDMAPSPGDAPPTTDPAIEAALESVWKQRRGEQALDHDQQPSESAASEAGPGQSDHQQSDHHQSDQGQSDPDEQELTSEDHESGANGRRRRRRGGRRRRRSGQDHASDGSEAAKSDESDSNGGNGSQHGGDDQTAQRSGGATQSEQSEDAADRAGGSSEDGNGRRRRRRRRRGEHAGSSEDDPSDVVVKVRDRRGDGQSGEVSGIEGSTRVEAKRARRREGRESSRRRSPILSEAEFLARRESVERKMIIRQADELAQIAVLEDGILVEHYVDRADSTSVIGNVYLGRVQNVLPSMEAAFVDIGRGRNAVLYAGDLDWDGLGAEGDDRKIEKVLKSGQAVLVQVTKDPLGAKGARLTHHISLPGRYVVYAPGGHVSGISRKLPEEERQRLKSVLSGPVDDDASVIVRTAAEGASEEELTRDVHRLQAQWQAIEKKVKAGQAPQLLYAEPDLTLRIVRDLFTEDFSELIIQGDRSMTDAYDSVDAYLRHVAPHLIERARRWDPDSSGDLFGSYRLDEQIAKGLERKVFLPSGGSLIIDRTEAMTVIDVNTGKFTGSGGNLEATVASNNLEAAEEIVRQLRLRDIGGIIVIDFIDMVLPDNRELLLRRLVECLGRDRTRHQVSEVTSLGLVQMTRKRIGSGLLEAFGSECPQCHGRGVELHEMPIADKTPADGGSRDDHGQGRGGRRRGRNRSGQKKQSGGQHTSGNDNDDHSTTAKNGKDTSQDTRSDTDSSTTEDLADAGVSS